MFVISCQGYTLFINDEKRCLIMNDYGYRAWLQPVTSRVLQGYTLNGPDVFALTECQKGLIELFGHNKGEYAISLSISESFHRKGIC